MSNQACIDIRLKEMMHTTFKLVCLKSLPTLWIALPISLYTLFLSYGIESLNAFHHFGSFAAGAIFGTCVSCILDKLCDFKTSTVFGILLSALCLSFLVMGFASPSIAYSKISLCLTSFAIIFILHINAFLSSKILETKLSLLLTLTGSALFCIYFWCHFGAFSPDSYSYFEISETFPFDYGKVSTTRQYVLNTELGISFPYFYPLLLWITDSLLGYGIYTGVFLNSGIALLTSCLLVSFGKKAGAGQLCGSTAALILLTCTPYLTEVCAARSIPLSLLLVLISIFLLIRMYKTSTWRNSRVFYSGMLLGAATVTRFDDAFSFAFLLVVFFIMAKPHRIKSILIFLSGALLPISPWILYSLINFSTIWVSDNSGTIFLVNTVVPARVEAEEAATQTLFNSPYLWVRALGGKALTVLLALLQCSMLGDVVISACFMVLFILLITKRLSCQDAKIFTVAILWFLLKTSLYALVGYRDVRYHAEGIIILSFVLLLILRQNISPDLPKSILTIAVCALTAFAGTTFISAELPSMRAKPHSLPLSKINQCPEWVETLDANLTAIGVSPDSGILMLSKAYEFGGWTGRNIFVDPKPATIATIDQLQSIKDIDCILLDASDENQAVLREALSEEYAYIDLNNWRCFYCTKRQNN